MYQRIRGGILLLIKDIRRLLPAMAGVAVYWIVTHLLFDRFCPTQILFNFPCPGCGMTRALMLVLSGQFGEAWRLQPPVYGWILGGAGFCVDRYLIHVEKRSAGAAKLWIVYFVLLLLWGMALYGLRLFTGIPVELMDPGRTLYRLLTKV